MAIAGAGSGIWHRTLANYTISKQIDLAPIAPGINVADWNVQDAYNYRAGRAVSSLDRPQVLFASAAWELPFGRGK